VTKTFLPISAACPGVDFTVPYKHSPSYSIGDYVKEFLKKTFDIIKSSLSIKKKVIVDFVKADLEDIFCPLQKKAGSQPRVFGLISVFPSASKRVSWAVS
jgi:hypothetical protein